MYVLFTQDTRSDEHLPSVTEVWYMIENYCLVKSSNELPLNIDKRFAVSVGKQLIDHGALKLYDMVHWNLATPYVVGDLGQCRLR